VARARIMSVFVRLGDGAANSLLKWVEFPVRRGKNSLSVLREFGVSSLEPVIAARALSRAGQICEIPC
jgi:hypothetical protein